MNVAYNMDCLAAMREMPDKTFTLAVCDPPYGIALTGKKKGMISKTRSIAERGTRKRNGTNKSLRKNILTSYFV